MLSGAQESSLAKFFGSKRLSEHAANNPLTGDAMHLARRYIGALLDLADQSKQIEAVEADMQALRHLWEVSSEWRFIASDPRWGFEFAVKAAEQVAKIANLSKLTGNFLCIIAQNRRLSLVPSFVACFFEEIAKRRGESNAIIRTAKVLTDAQKDALEKALSKVTGGKVHLSVTEDPSIIGGLTVKLGSNFIDASVKTRLDLLERALQQAPSHDVSGANKTQSVKGAA